MPIFYKDHQRVLFSHIPKAAGSSIYIWFLENGFFISNLHMQVATGVGKEINKRYNISQLQLEGELPEKINPQHATKEYFKSWGEFTSKFCIVRHPLSRITSEIGYLFPSYCYKNKINQPTMDHARQFTDLFFERFILSEEASMCYLDNHLRHQVDFIDEKMPVLYYEGAWKEWLKNEYRLKGDAPQLNQSLKSISFKKLFSKEMEEEVYKKYKKDYEILGYPKSIDEIIAD